jgi:hypothetical protein
LTIEAISLEWRQAIGGLILKETAAAYGVTFTSRRNEEARALALALEAKSR